MDKAVLRKKNEARGVSLPAFSQFYKATASGKRGTDTKTETLISGARQKAQRQT